MISFVCLYLPFRDAHFNLALLFGPIFWTSWFFLSHPVLNLSRAISDPETLLILAVIFPVLEEIVFRGWIQETLFRMSKGAKLLPSVSVSNILTSLLFSFLHLFFHSVFWSCLVIIPSLVFGYFKDRHNSLFSCIILHVFYNLGYFLLFNNSVVFNA